MASNEVVVVTGMSGAGRSTVAHAMEDLGWYVVDNLPPSMLADLCQMAAKSATSIAVVIDVRGRHFFDDLSKALGELTEKSITHRVLFVDAADDVLVRRFESTRRPHPLQGTGRIVDGISKERERLQEVRSVADIVVDSSSLNIHQLEKKVGDLFDTHEGADLRVNILSFGYKYGIPVDADLVTDCRFISNPFWVPELRPLNGLDQPVKDAVLETDNVQLFLDRYIALFETMATGFIHEGRKYLTLAVGCTGGKHRSVAIAHELAKRLDGLTHSTGKKISAAAIDRDLGREV